MPLTSFPKSLVWKIQPTAVKAETRNKFYKDYAFFPKQSLLFSPLRSDTLNFFFSAIPSSGGASFSIASSSREILLSSVEVNRSMDLKSSSPSPVLTENVSINKSWMALLPNSLMCSSPPATFSAGLHLTIPRKKTGLLDDVRASGWLDAMKASSPPPRMMIRDFNHEDADADTVYRTWMLKYPSAIVSFDRIINYATGKKIVLFLDYDGTLSPIVDNPDRAFMSRSMRKAVKCAAKLFPTAIISGRSRDKVFGFVGLTELYYAGSHGMDIMSPVGQSLIENQPNGSQNQQKESLFQPASEFLPMIDEVLKALIEATKDIDGAKVENNKFCVSVHYRNVEITNWQLVGEIVTNILKGYPKLRLSHGRKVLEVRPVIDWDKGKAVMFLLESLGLNNCEDVLPIYVGDDRTDEDAFKVLREGNRGYGILVSSVPKESNAYYSLRDPSQVMEFLQALVRSKKL